MPTRTASAEWRGGLRGGSGSYKGQGALGGSYTFGSRFEEAAGSNPEELLAAAHASCFSMFLAGVLEKNGSPAESIATTARCTVEKVGDGFTITRMQLDCRGRVPGIDEAKFREHAETAKKGCPVSRALTGLELQVQASLES